MILNREVSRALVAGAVVALGLAACATDTTSRQLSAAGQAEPRTAGRTAADAGITGKVKAALAADDLVKARNINVDTIRGVVQLNGTVGSSAEKERALSLARRVEGVVEVKDNLKTSG